MQDRLAEIEDRVYRAMNQALDGMERQLAPPPAPVAPHPTDDPEALAARRWLSDQLALHVMCDRVACERAGRCHGRHVLCYLLHLGMVPPAVMAGLRAWTEACQAGIAPHTLRGDRAASIAALADWRLRFGLDPLPAPVSLDVAAARARAANKI